MDRYHKRSGNGPQRGMVTGRHIARILNRSQRIDERLGARSAERRRSSADQELRRGDAVVVVEGQRITQVGSGDAAVPAGAAVVDLRRYTAVPGLIDVHTHMTFYWDGAPGTRPWTQLGSLGAAVTVFLAQENARRTLAAGVTTVRDLGSWEYTDIAMRDLVNRGAMTGPRMFVAGYGLYVTNTP